MTGFGVMLLATYAVVLAAAMDPPEVTRSFVPSYLEVGGKQTINPALPDASTEFFVVVRDALNMPVAGADVSIYFQNCTDLLLCSATAAGQTVDCASRVVHGTT